MSKTTTKKTTKTTAKKTTKTPDWMKDCLDVFVADNGNEFPGVRFAFDNEKGPLRGFFCGRGKTARILDVFVRLGAKRFEQLLRHIADE